MEAKTRQTAHESESDRPPDPDERCAEPPAADLEPPSRGQRAENLLEMTDESLGKPPEALLDERLKTIARLAAEAANSDGESAQQTPIFIDDTRPMLRIIVRGPQARKAAKAANRFVELCSPRLPRKARFAWARPNSRYFLRSTDAMQAAAYKSLFVLRGEWEERLCAVRRDLGPEAVHRFRVVTRRLRSILRAYRSPLGKKTTAPLESAARTIARSSNAARELDTLARRVQDADCPQLHTRIAVERQQAMRQHLQVLENAVSPFRDAYDAILEAVHPMRRKIARPKAQLPLRKAGPKRAEKSQRKLKRAGVEAMDDEQLHDLRIRAKRLRYFVEALSERLPKKTRKIADRMKRFQDLLGEDRDAAEHEAYLQRFLSESRELPPEEKAELERLTAQLREAQAEARSAFVEAWSRYAERGKRGKKRGEEDS